MRLKISLLKILSIPFSTSDALGGPMKIFPFLFIPSLNHFHSPSSLHAELCTLTVNSYHPSLTLPLSISISKTRYFTSLHPNKISCVFSVKFIPDHLISLILFQSCTFNICDFE